MNIATRTVLNAVPSLDPARRKKAAWQRTTTIFDSKRGVARYQEKSDVATFHRGRAFRRTCAVTTAAPVLATTNVMMDAIRPAVTSVAGIAYAVAGPLAGVAGASLGVLVGSLFKLAPVEGGMAGYRIGHCIVHEVLKFAAKAVIWTAELVQKLLVTLAAYLGYVVGSVLTAPTLLMARRPEA